MPEHLVIVGGSYIGLEFAQMFRRFGSEVTVVEMAPRLIAREDEDVSTGDRARCWRARASGAPRRTATCRSTQRGDGVAVSVDVAGTARRVDRLASAARGRTAARTPTISASTRPGVAIDARGYIEVDDQLRTSVPGIWALGDCNGRGAFTHTSYNDFEIVAANLLDDESSPRHRPDLRLCALHRSAARPRRHDGGRGAQDRQTRAGRPACRWRTSRAPSRRARPAGLMKMVVDGGDQADSRRGVPGLGGDEVDPLRARPDVCEGAVHRAAARDAHPPDGGRIPANHRRRTRAGLE